MGRTKARAFEQPNDYTCGPAALKTALLVLGKNYSLKRLIELCKSTKKDGTTVKKMVRAANSLGISVMCVQNTTLRHMQSALKNNPRQPRSIIVEYLQDKNDLESGHWSTVASYSAKNGKIILFDPSDGVRRSYKWNNFIENHWFDYQRIKGKASGKPMKKWSYRLMLVLTRERDHLPKFKTKNAKVYAKSSAVKSFLPFGIQTIAS
jgi:ABC-type bacteriocin/lantibiotic exporter with double-glycine peptidase domain